MREVIDDLSEYGSDQDFEDDFPPEDFDEARNVAFRHEEILGRLDKIDEMLAKLMDKK